MPVTSWPANARDELARRLIGVLGQNPPQTSVAARVDAGDVLGQLGDPRFSGPYLLPEFIPIPAGRFWMGSDEGEIERLVRETGEDWPKRELPRHQVVLDTFALARYPTTNAMFCCFVEDGGYAEGRWWDEARTAKVWQSGGTVKDLFGDLFGHVCDQPRYWDDARLNGPNQPVVGVTWYEALAYCRWLTAALGDGYTYRLPMEAEWERAARGPDGHHYPWGDQWEEGRANSKELSPERTTPVGIFPDGGSAEGLLDLAGNVWEWCSTACAGYPYNAGNDRESLARGTTRILRGGSWYNHHNRVRCASRDNARPDLRLDRYGFRVARGPAR